MERRRFLAGASAGVAGLALGGASLGGWQVERGRQEAAGAAAAGEPGPVGRCQLVWSVPTDRPLAALTFDDGPDPAYTPRILEVLARHDVRATFNVMGRNAVRHADLLRAVVAAGHEVGNHTWSHEDLAFQSAAATRRELERGARAIEQVTGVRPRLFRPPRGALTGSSVLTAAALGCDVLLWSVARGPAGVGTPRQVADHLAATVAPGDVVALHDGIGRGTFDRGSAASRLLERRRAVEVAALPSVLDRLLGRGLRLVTASALLDAAAAAPPPAALRR